MSEKKQYIWVAKWRFGCLWVVYTSYHKDLREPYAESLFGSTTETNALNRMLDHMRWNNYYDWVVVEHPNKMSKK
jgi:hypothetical protein